MERICCANCFTKYFLFDDIKSCPKCKTQPNKSKKAINIDIVDIGNSTISESVDEE